MRRQETYLQALNASGLVQLQFGHYLKKSRRCRHCNTKWVDFEEKMTDVNIATQMLSDAFDDCFDTALLVSADGDLTTPVRSILERFPEKRIVAVRPPGRNSAQLVQAASAHLFLGKANLRRSILPDRVRANGGYILKRPESWR